MLTENYTAFLNTAQRMQTCRAPISFGFDTMSAAIHTAININSTDDEQVHNFSFFLLPLSHSPHSVDFVYLSVAFHLCHDVGKFEFVYTYYIVVFYRWRKSGQMFLKWVARGRQFRLMAHHIASVTKCRWSLMNDTSKEKHDEWPCHENTFIA